jgi:hypothetical protein
MMCVHGGARAWWRGALVPRAAAFGVVCLRRAHRPCAWLHARMGCEVICKGTSCPCSMMTPCVCVAPAGKHEHHGPRGLGG